MRSLASFAAVAAVASTISTDPAADACGPPPVPHLLRVSSHVVLHESYDAFGRTHSFVLFDELAPADAAWRQLAPRSFDTTQIADAPKLDRPLEFTLLGPWGQRVVTTNRRVYLKPELSGDRTAHVAVEIDAVDRNEVVAAIAGRPSHLVWRTLGKQPQHDIEAVAWLADHGVRVKYAHVETIADDDTQLVTYYDDGSRFAIRRGNANLGVHPGVVRGELVSWGQRLLVLDDLSTIAI
jgi:hypothetical protein